VDHYLIGTETLTSYVQSADDDIGPYKDTVWLRDRGHIKPMSLNHRHLQRRFDRIADNFAKVMAELKETLEQVDDIETLRASYEAKLAKAKSQYEAAQADITNLILDVREGEESNEVTFRTTTGEYDPAFVLCVMFAICFTSYQNAITIIKFVFEALTGKKIIDNPTRKFQQDCFRRLGVLEEMQVQ